MAGTFFFVLDEQQTPYPPKSRLNDTRNIETFNIRPKTTDASNGLVISLVIYKPRTSTDYHGLIMRENSPNKSLKVRGQ